MIVQYLGLLGHGSRNLLILIFRTAICQHLGHGNGSTWEVGVVV